MLDRSNVSDTILVPTFLCEIDYSDRVELVELVAKTFRNYVDIREVEAIQLGYKQVLMCSYLDDDDEIKYDIIGASVVAYD